MYAVGKVGSLISRSVYTVSGPFHPFGGAVDIVVVQQQDGSFKSSPWYVRFGKFQGVLKTREKVVNISVNGVEAGFHMYLDSNGEAYFLRDADPNGQEGEFFLSPASSGDEKEEVLSLRKSKSTSCDNSTMEADVEGNKILARTTTARRVTILERVFGRKSVDRDAHSVERVSSLERAEIAAELLDTKWSTNLSRGSSSRNSVDQPSKSIVADPGNSDQKETSEIVVPGHSFHNGKEMESNCIDSDCNLSSSPGGGRNGSANETDNCLQTTSLQKEVVEIYTHESSDFRITSTADQAGSEYLSNDLGTDNSIHESVDTIGGSLHNFENVTERELHTKKFLSDGVFEIHSVDTEITDGQSEVVSHFVTGDSDGANRNSVDTSLPTYRTTDVLTEKHDVLTISSPQDVVEDKMIIISSTTESYAMSTISADKVHDSAYISLTDGVDIIEEHSIASPGIVEQLVSEEYRDLSNKEDTINAVVHDHADSVSEDLQPNGPDMESSAGTVLDYCSTDPSPDLACKRDLVCPDASSNNEGILMLENVPENMTKDTSVEQLISEQHRDVSSKEDMTNAVVQDHADSFSEDLQANGPDMESSAGTVLDYCGTASSPDLACNHDLVCPDASSNIDGILMLENVPENITKDSSVEKEVYSEELSVSVTQASPTGEGSGECIVKFANFSNDMKVEDFPVNTDEIETPKTKTDDPHRPVSTSGDEIRSMQEEAEETEAAISFSEHIEEIQFQFSDTESFADTKVMDEMIVNKKADEEYDESDCDAEEQQKGCNDSVNDLENCSVPLITETSPLPIPGCELHYEDNSIGAKSLPNLRSHIHDLERSNSVQLSRSLCSISENNAVEPDKNMNSKEQEPEASVDPEENGKAAELTSKLLEDEHTSDLKVDSFNPVAELSLCRHLLFEGMGEDAARRAFDSEKVSLEKFRTMKQSLTRNNRLVVRIAGRYFPWDAAAPIVLGMISFSEEQAFEPQGMIKVESVETSLAPGGSWRIWPFSFRRTQASSTVEPVCESIVKASLPPVKEADRVIKIKSRNKRMDRKVRSLTPTSEELASLDLREGRNVITFTFSTAMLGKQQVDCRIYLWKWNTRIVISDVDGTITKSDVLGQFMPLVGVDWSQNGVAHLFSAIKENGYQLLFLSARAISQAHLTRQFLFNLKQDGKALPDGPVVISPDGLFPSLYREVIRRAPHEFKISCLEAIRSLFPPESNPNPFYAGFGNRDTDELSYLKVGIPLGKIFIINPKGEVAVNRRVDTKSYTSLHALVNGMFPPISLSPEQEDYNSWNYWKMPLPDI